MNSAVTDLEADLLEEAAGIIESGGWWNGTWSDRPGEGGHGTCIWTAVLEALTAKAKANNYPTSMLVYFSGKNSLLDALIHHFKLPTDDLDKGAGELFRLNDRQSPEDGPVWAATHLRRCASEVRSGTEADDG